MRVSYLDRAREIAAIIAEEREEAEQREPAPAPSALSPSPSASPPGGSADDEPIAMDNIRPFHERRPASDAGAATAAGGEKSERSEESPPHSPAETNGSTPPHPSTWRTRLPGPDGEPCPACASPLAGWTCWACMKRLCRGCGILADGVLNAYCPACRLTPPAAGP